MRWFIFICLVVSTIADELKPRQHHSVDCIFDPIVGVRAKIGEVTSFNMTCTNNQWENDYMITLINIEQMENNDAMKLCVVKEESGYCGDYTSQSIWINMTQPKQTYVLKLMPKSFGISCVKQKAYYQEGEYLFTMQSGGENKVRGYSALNSNITSENTDYSEILIVGRRTIKPRTKHQTSVAPSNASVNVASLSDIGSMVQPPGGGQVVQYSIFMSQRISPQEEDAGTISKLLTYMTLALANFVIGTAIDGRELRNLYKKVTSMCRQFSCFSRLFTVSPWKVGLFCQFVYVPLLSYCLGLLIFRVGVECNEIVSLTRLGLFLLGISPGNTQATYFSTILNGDLSLSVSLVILSTLFSPVSLTFWLVTLGPYVTEKDTKSTGSVEMEIPFALVFQFTAALTIPVVLGIVVGTKFPMFKEWVAFIRKPFIVVGIIGALFVYYFMYKNFFTIFSWRHAFACGILAMGSTFAAGITAFFAGLSWPQIISIGIDTGMKNSQLSFAMLKGVYSDPPEGEYATTPANAQIFFTSLPLLLIWAAWSVRDLLIKYMGNDTSSRQATFKGELRTAGGSTVAVVKIKDIKETWADHDLRPLWV